jgi:hypothetical protein
MTTIIPSIEEAIARMKQEIIADVKSGRVSADCPSFSALHDYVDANEYGGFCEGDMMAGMIKHFGGWNENEVMPNKMMEYLNKAQNAIDLWIKKGGIVDVRLTQNGQCVTDGNELPSTLKTRLPKPN